MDRTPKKLNDCSLYLENIKNIEPNILNFILKADRIDKKSPAFKGVIEEVKRMQKSSILYTVLLSDIVELGIGNPELPRAYKVFAAKDVREDKTRKVFIDATGIIQLKDGYFICKKIDVLISYLFTALANLLYLEAPGRVLNDSTITISGTECFVSMVDYILEYMRIIGYSANKSKILYITGIYYLKSVLGKDLDTYTKNIAAKAAGLSTSEIRGFDLYYEEEDLSNISTYVNLIAETFKLKGLTNEVFVAQWMRSFGPGTQYGMEFFPAFSHILTSTYCGSYIVGQKQVERCCAKSMINFSNGLLRAGIEEFDKRGFMEDAALESLMNTPSKETLALSEAILGRKKIPESAKYNKEDCKSKAAMKTKINSIIAYYRSVEQQEKISKTIVDIVKSALHIQKKYINDGGEIYEVGAIETVLKTSSKYLNDNDRRIIKNDIKEKAEEYGDSSNIAKAKAKDPDKASRMTKCVVELRKCLSI